MKPERCRPADADDNATTIAQGRGEVIARDRLRQLADRAYGGFSLPLAYLIRNHVQTTSANQGDLP